MKKENDLWKQSKTESVSSRLFLDGCCSCWALYIHGQTVHMLRLYCSLAARALLRSAVHRPTRLFRPQFEDLLLLLHYLTSF
jgi:hypothetical protein